MDKLRYFSENIDVKNKTVILRLDLNVPISEKKIQDESRVLSCLPFLKNLIKRHFDETDSTIAKQILDDFNIEKNNFFQVCPKEMLNKLKNPISSKNNIEIASINGYFSTLLDEIQQSLFDQAKTFQLDNTHIVNSYEDFKDIIKKGGFVKCGWDGSDESEEKIKKDTKATIRCIPFNQDTESLKCIYSDTQAKYQVIFARAY